MHIFMILSKLTSTVCLTIRVELRFLSLCSFLHIATQTILLDIGFILFFYTRCSLLFMIGVPVSLLIL